MSTERIIDTVKRLIAFDTTSRNSNLELIACAQNILEDAGARCRLTFDEDGAKANLFATLGPERAGGFVLSGHTDVVPVDGQLWSSDPFAPEIRDGKLYGRGAADMKGFVGAVLAMVPEVDLNALKQPLHFALSFDEEVGCVGVRALLNDLEENGIKPALAIIGEPTEMKVVGAHKAGGVAITTARGREGHSSAPARGANAVMMAGEFISILAEFGEEMKENQDEHFDPPYTTVQANMIKGGTAVNVLARETEIFWEYRALPDGDFETIVDRVSARAAEKIIPRYRSGAPDAAFETLMKASYPGLVRDLNSPAVHLACAVAGSNDVHAVSYGTEAGLFQAAGIPAVVCGPGSINQAHRADEFVELEQLRSCETFLRGVVERAYRSA
jgi:acetylornithine deacetylase